MASWHPMRNLSRPSTSRSSQTSKRPTALTSSNGPNKRRSRLIPASPSSSYGNDDRTPAGTPIPIQPRVRTNGDHNEEESQDDFDDSLDHVVLAIDKSRKNTIGCSYYVAKHGVLYCMEDIESAGEDTVQSCKTQPHLV